MGFKTKPSLAEGTLVAGNGVSVGAGELLSGSGTLIGSLFLGDGGTVSMTGEISGAVRVLPGGVVTANGDLTMGDASTNLGFWGDGTLNVGPHTVTLHDGARARLGSSTTLAGGTLVAANGVSLGATDSLAGSGQVQAEVFGAAGSSIVATGNLTIGDPNTGSGVELRGTVAVGDHAVTLLDASAAKLGSGTTITGGILAAPRGIALGDGDTLIATGQVRGPVAGETGSTITASGPLTMWGTRP